MVKKLIDKFAKLFRRKKSDVKRKSLDMCWTRVQDELPEKYEDVLVKYEALCGHDMYCVAHLEYDGVWISNTLGFTSDNVLGWMRFSDFPKCEIK